MYSLSTVVVASSSFIRVVRPSGYPLTIAWGWRRLSSKLQNGCGRARTSMTQEGRMPMPDGEALVRAQAGWPREHGGELTDT